MFELWSKIFSCMYIFNQNALKMRSKSCKIGHNNLSLLLTNGYIYEGKCSPPLYSAVRARSTCTGYIRRLLPTYLPRSRIRHPDYTPLEIDKNSYPTKVHVNNLKEANFKDLNKILQVYREVTCIS